TSTINATTLAVGDDGYAVTHALKLGNVANTLNVNTLNMGTGLRAGGWPSFNTAAGTLTLRDLAGRGRGEVNMATGGTTSGTAAVGTLTVNGGTLDMLGHKIGGATLIDVLAFQSGTLKNIGEINNGAALTKTTAGTLTLDGTSAYTGLTDVQAGIVKVISNG